ncbi:MAG: hypothetical protein HY926_00340 [Elusimicrobia bacterium]|nr:hypothetical protein [Elusimicrobiota bacterium]
MRLLILLHVLGVAAIVAALLIPRHRRPAAAGPDAAGPLDPGEDGLPGMDQPFPRIDILDSPSRRAHMIAHYVNEEAAAYEAREEDGLFLIDQPAQVPARWDYDIHGLALGKTRLAGDFDAQVVLDLERSRFTARKGDPDRYSRFILDTVFAGEGRPTAWAYFSPAGRCCPQGVVWNGSNQDRLTWKKLPRRLAFHLRRRDDRLTVTAATEEGPLGRVLDWQAAEVRRPVRQIDLYVQVDRPQNAAKDAVWKAPGQDVYAVKAFTVSCADPKGCTVRVRP